MELHEVLRRRRMTRSFTSEPIADALLDRVLAAALRAPSAGNTQATDLVVLAGPEQTARYWDVTLPAERRERFAFPGLMRAPVLVVVAVSPDAYARRYAERDKSTTGLAQVDRWTVPYWYVDAGFTAMLLQLAAIDAGLGVAFFGVFEHDAAVRGALGIPDDRVLAGTLALGHPDRSDERPGRSASRPRRSLDEVVHRGSW